MSKLTAEKVVEIRALRQQGYELKMIAEMFDVSMECISQVARGVRWSHVHPAA
jgi:transcriptional regulator